MRIYVIRHGLTELNKKNIVNGQIDESLAPEGVEQATVALSLLPKSIKYIYTSPLQRAQETAKIINSKLDRPIYVANELTEIHMGVLAGHSWEEMESGADLKKKHRTVKFNYRPHGGESVKDVKKRLVVFLKMVKSKHRDNEVLIITHGGIIRVLSLLEQNTAIYETEKHASLLTFDLDKILKNP